MIALVGVNARYTHSSLGLRYLHANLKELQKDTKILEFTINEDESQIAEQILLQNPKIIGFGVYIWNAPVVQKLVEIIKKVSPEIKIILGGPEVSYLPFRVDWDMADFIIQGEGEISFYNICRDILDDNKIESKIIRSITPNLKEIELPYRFYSDDDIKNRYIYVEASRGCIDFYV